MRRRESKDWAGRWCTGGRGGSTGSWPFPEPSVSETAQADISCHLRDVNTFLLTDCNRSRVQDLACKCTQEVNWHLFDDTICQLVRICKGWIMQHIFRENYPLKGTTSWLCFEGKGWFLVQWAKIFSYINIQWCSLDDIETWHRVGKKIYNLKHQTIGTPPLLGLLSTSHSASHLIGLSGRVSYISLRPLRRENIGK